MARRDGWNSGYETPSYFLFICCFWSAHSLISHSLWPLSQCCQQSNHHNFFSFFFTYSQQITQLFTKSWQKRVHRYLFSRVFTYLLIRFVLVVILIQLQVITVIALHQPQSQGLSSSEAGARKRHWERGLLFIVCHACSPLKGFGSAALLAGTLPFGPKKKVKQLKCT